MKQPPDYVEDRAEAMKDRRAVHLLSLPMSNGSSDWTNESALGFLAMSHKAAAGGVPFRSFKSRMDQYTITTVAQFAVGASDQPSSPFDVVTTPGTFSSPAPRSRSCRSIHISESDNQQVASP